ncbi:helix-turn-helix transcriptional regulator [Segeticoccus rhizosphaerae]|jgi:DNA-binding CsgD family transcriptional regulator/tetratricopeptide (TPR) repeat protein|uniref:helix-turn-helix transcriptional regulator n=1 Tax=Segeticoccus rhizosphaerae TaxID=1104777 RepID=UPI0010C05397|nr:MULTISPECIES: helix-turn-helix transcriptional regulator [Intrasporangiaceae]
MLTGREAECALLERLIAGARVGTSGVLVITGDAGIGKSALLDHATQLAAGMCILRAAGSAVEHAISFGGLQHLLRPVTGLLDRIPRRQAEALGAALALGPGHVTDRFTVGAGTLSLICRSAEERPVAVIVDDAHWLDVASAEALAFAARRLLADPVVVVVAAREVPATRPIREALPQLHLSGLDRAATGELLSQRRMAPVAEGTVDRLLEVTAGNPLAILELADLPGVESDSLTVPLPVSDSLAEGFAGRAAELGAEAQWALLLAATEGGRAATVLRALRASGGGASDLVEAEASGLISLTPDRVVFRHPLVRSAVYSRAAPDQRRAAHAAVAGAIASRGGGAAGGVARADGGETRGEDERRVWHLAEAAVGPDSSVAAMLESVARRATTLGAYAAASVALERAARLSDAEPEANARFIEAAEAALLAGREDQADRLLAGADDGSLDRLHKVRVLAVRGAVAARQGSLLESLDLLLAAADLVDTPEGCLDPEQSISVLVDALEATLYLADGGTAGVLARRLERLLPLVRDPHVRDLCVLSAGIARVLSGEGGTEQIAAAVHSLTASGPSAVDPSHLGWLLLGPLWLREAGAGRELVQRVATEVRDRGAVARLPFLLFLLGRDDATTDRWDEAEASYTEGIRLARETGRVVDMVTSLAGLAWLEARQGRADLCRAHAAEVLELFPPRHLNLCGVWTRFALADLELGLGRPALALEHLTELRAILRAGGLADVDLSPVPELAECSLRVGRAADPGAGGDDSDVAGLAVDAAEMLRVAEAKGQPWALARAHRAVALLAEGTAVEQHFILAAHHHAQTMDIFESARTAMLFGSWLRRSRQRVRARPVLREALVAFERLGADPWANAAAVELAATGETVHRRAADSLDELTPQQLQIATLLASGRTTREAAAALFVSRKTIEYHLRNVYLKLGISSRQELAEAMRR